MAATAVYSTLSYLSSWSSLGAAVFDKAAARSVVTNELNAVSGIPEDWDEVRALMDEGRTDDVFLASRALAFSDIDDARAILVADREDEEAEEEEERRRSMRPRTVGIPVAAAGER